MFCVFVSKHSQTHFIVRDLNLIPFFKVRTLVFRMQTIYLLKLVLFFNVPFYLCSAYDATVPARGKELIKTDLQIKLPTGCYGRIAPRSGLAVHHHIDVGGRCK
jgi:hypothetical protein